MDGLPPGFQLDAPADLPPGFQLDAPGAQPEGKRKIGDVAADAADRAMGFTKGQVADAESKVRGQPSSAQSLGSTLDVLRGIFSSGVGVAAHGARGVRRGASMLAGLPVDLTALGLRAAGVPVSASPVGGSASIDRALGGFGLIPEPPTSANPIQRTAENVAERVGQEIGANALPVAGTIEAGIRMGVPAARAMANAPGTGLPAILKRFGGRALEAGAVDPAGLAAREAGFATAAGTGAGIANEVAGNPQHGDNFKSDFTGSLLGVLGHSLAGGLIGASRGAVSAITGRPTTLDDIVGQAVADRIINNSTTMQQAATQGPVDTAALVEALRQPSTIEAAVPGYKANIAERASDPGLMTFTYNTDTLAPGAALARRTANEGAVTERLAGLAPQGDAGQFRDLLSAARDAKIAAAQEEARRASSAFEQARYDVQPTLADPTARGDAIRGALQQASDTAYAAGPEAEWAAFRALQQPVDVSPLVEQFAARDASLSPTEARRFQPGEAGDVARMAPPEGEQALRPVSDVAGVRSGLSDTLLSPDIRPNERRIVSGYRDELDRFLEQSTPPEVGAQYTAARGATRDFNERFTRPGSAIADTLARREGGAYARDPSTVPTRFTPTDRGAVTDFRDLMREAGTDARARGAVADQVMAEAQRLGALENPDKMARFLSERSIVLGEFPEVSNRLQNVGFSKAMQTDAEQRAAEITANLTRGQGPVPQYLKYGPERSIDAIRTVTNAGDPRAAARELLAQAGDSAEARAGLRDAFWQDAMQSGQDSAKTAAGGTKWNGRKLAAFLKDPKREAVAEELWRDNPEELDNIRGVFEALAGAEGSTRARAPGASGTAQALNAKYEPALSAGSLASRARSVQRGVLSYQVAAIDILATYIRRRKAQVQERAIDTLTSAVVNDPEMAAVLLERYNPADLPAKRRMLTQKFGVRGTQVANLLDEAQNNDKTVEAVKGQ